MAHDILGCIMSNHCEITRRNPDRSCTQKILSLCAPSENQAVKASDLSLEWKIYALHIEDIGLLNFKSIQRTFNVGKTIGSEMYY